MFSTSDDLHTLYSSSSLSHAVQTLLKTRLNFNGDLGMAMRLTEIQTLTQSQMSVSAQVNI